MAEIANNKIQSKWYKHSGRYQFCFGRQRDECIDVQANVKGRDVKASARPSYDRTCVGKWMLPLFECSLPKVEV